ncbi:dihydrofolate synthase / folylpolyglutamate synthase [Robiginitalea myxolifaciens]|uniref:Dihydrofolate synthase/folylpolyglutamate synthase n=1 Tax=Robiginitalea myxolifaciens TaxID=400055 RepID=A0A1I6HLP1_9FLAO|nr:folylpolyglutamate synthase/dihydrofolate synthase family protein [Robiginitalea myxolifaciens]SFR55389.1 dihydrofolate synthase / folylpolyglutamate synthase [Robiginitalea myxolifaciens]
MDYRGTLEWLFARLPMYQQRGASAYSGKLEPVRNFADYLGNPHHSFKSIHVAGTNGKGSSSHMLASVLQEAGYKVGLYTSPHLKDFRERIRVNGTMASEDFVVDFVADHRTYIEEAGLSFFELTVGMAFTYFAQEEVDIAVVEVGLGGRLDATNIISPEVSLITNIGLDHTEFLGDTLPEIAGEKAGIIKESVPVVISETQPETAPVFEEIANGRNAPIVFADQRQWPVYPISLLGSYQQKNLRGVLAVLDKLSEQEKFKVSTDEVTRGLASVAENTGLLGRWQVLQENPRVLCDTAHNREGLAIVLEQLVQEPFEQLHVVLSFVKGKPLEQLLPLFPSTAQFYIAPLQIERGMPLEELVAGMEAQGFSFTPYDSIPEALEKAIASAQPDDLIYVGGSTFTVAEVI